MAIIVFILFGFVVGLLARALVPGDQPTGFILTSVLGIAGSFVGGFFASFVTHHRVTDLHMAGFIGSVIGAVVLLALVQGTRTRRAVL